MPPSGNFLVSLHCECLSHFLIAGTAATLKGGEIYLFQIFNPVAGRVWWRKAAHLLGTRKQRGKGGAAEGKSLPHHVPGDLSTTGQAPALFSSKSALTLV